ncbi:MAG: hypothetical protein M3256_19020, partial [Actinomycetota bacterium]|nr:hypothetical protein [Actinomycetota bacterium]
PFELSVLAFAIAAARADNLGISGVSGISVLRPPPGSMYALSPTALWGLGRSAHPSRVVTPAA